MSDVIIEILQPATVGVSVEVVTPAQVSVPVEVLSSVALSDAVPTALSATGSAGVSSRASRSDHVHPRPTATEVGADPAGTASALMAAHTAAADPHAQYETAAEVQAKANAAQAAAEATAATLYGQKRATTTLSLSGTLTAPSADTLYVCNCAVQSMFLALPSPSACGGLAMSFKRVGDLGTATLLGPIDTAAQYVLEYTDEFVTLVSDGSKFHLVAE